MMNATERAAHLNRLSSGLHLSTRGTTFLSKYFAFKARVYRACRHNGGKLEVYVVTTSGLDCFVGYASDVSDQLSGAAALAVLALDRELALTMRAVMS